MEKTKQENWALKPDAQAFDEVRLRIVPRFKESELSGSEWRTSVQIDFMRNGKVIVQHNDNPGDMQNACGLLYHRYAEMSDNGHGFFASDTIHCDQEGCHELGKYVYRIKQDYCTGGGKCGQKKDSYTGALRIFCPKHKRRGDQDRQDCDKNYELVYEI